MLARATTWWMILRISLEERLVYRGDFALGTLMRFLPIVTQIFLWGAVFAANGNEKIAGKYTYGDMVAYYLLTMVARAFSSMPGLASNIALDIRTGGIKKFLVQPIDMLGFLLAGRMAHKLVYYAVATGPFALVFWLCRGYFPGWPPLDILAVFIASLLLGFLFGFFLETAIGMVGFWFLEVSSLLFIYMLFSFFLSGHMFPLEMLQGPWAVWTAVFLPLQYLAYFPAAVFLQIIPREQAYWGLAIEVVWVVVLMAGCRWAYAAGVRRYSAFGG